MGVLSLLHDTSEYTSDNIIRFTLLWLRVRVSTVLALQHNYDWYVTFTECDLLLWRLGLISPLAYFQNLPNELHRLILLCLLGAYPSLCSPGGSPVFCLTNPRWMQEGYSGLSVCVWFSSRFCYSASASSSCFDLSHVQYLHHLVMLRIISYTFLLASYPCHSQLVNVTRWKAGGPGR